MTHGLRLHPAATLLALLLFAAPARVDSPAPRWGSDGHEMAARAAAAGLPADMPAFFRDAEAHLAYLNPEPDRWRDREFREMDQAFSYDHYVDLENVPPGALDAPDRYEYLGLLHAAGLPKPERDAGLLPFRIVELYQRLATEWRMWSEADATTRPWIEQRILNDAGTLGHYVTDGSQPHHTTIHFNGWNASGVRQEPNPEGFTEARDFHGRFESGFVRLHVDPARVAAAAAAPARRVDADARGAVMEFLNATHTQVVPLYRLEKEFGFVEEGATPAPETVDFAVARLAAGAEMLRDLWWSAYLQGTGR